MEGKKPHILVVGSFVMDQIATTEVFPSEGQTVLGKHFSKAPGGKGANQAVQAALLGAEVTMVGKVGADSNGQDLLNACRKAGVNAEHVLVDPEIPSGCAVIILQESPEGQTKNRIIVLPGTNMAITEQDVAFLADTIGQYDLVLLQLEIPMKINELVAGYANRAGVPVMLNPAPSAPLSGELLEKLTYISPNEHEAEDITGISVRIADGTPDPDGIRAAAKALRDRGVTNIVITLGKDGAYMDMQGQTAFVPAVRSVKAVDPTAAGDSFIGAFCVAQCQGMQGEETLLFANNTAALTVSRLGAIPSLPDFGEVDAFMRNAE